MKDQLKGSTFGLISSRPLHAAAIVSATLIGIALSGCSAGNLLDPEPKEDRPRIALSAGATSIGAEGGSLTAEVSSTGEGTLNWTASVDVTWVSLQGSSSGSDDATLTLSFDANESTDERTATLTVRSASALNSPQTLTLTQEGAEPEPDPTIEATVARYTIEPDGETIMIDVAPSKEDLEWEAVAITATWARVLGLDTGTGTGRLSVEVDANDTDASRSLLIIIRLADRSEIAVELNFSQAAQPPVELRAMADRTTLPADGGEAVITVSLNRASAIWSAQVDGQTAPAWVQLNRSGDTLAVRVQANNSAAERTFSVTIASAEAINSPQSLQFTQEAADLPALHARADSYTVDASGGQVEIAISFSGGSSGLKPGWRAAVSVGMEYAHIAGASSGNGDGTLTIEVDDNSAEAQRAFELTMESDDARGVPQTLRFVQKAAEAARVQVTASDYTIDAGGGAITVSVQADGSVQWSAEARGDFIYLLGSSGGSGSGSISVEVDANEKDQRRTFEITVTPVGGDPQTVGFVQGAADTSDARVTLTSKDYTVSADASTVAINVEADVAVEWTVQASGDFAHLVGSSSGTGNGTLTVSVDANEEEAQRSFTVTVTPDNGDARTVSFVQEGMVLPESPDNRVTAMADDYTVAAVGAAITITVAAEANTEWSAAVTADFAHLVGSSSGTGNGSLTIEVDANSGTEQRSFEVTVTPGNGAPHTLHFIQRGVQPAALSVAASHSDQSVPYTGGTVRLDIQNTGGGQLNWIVSVEEDWASVSGAASGTNTGSVVVVLDENESVRRHLVVTVTAEGALGSPQTIRITQEEPPKQLEPAARVTANKYSVSPDGETVTVSIDVTGNDDLKWEAVLSTREAGCVISGNPNAMPPTADRTFVREGWVRFLGSSSSTGDGEVQVQVDETTGHLCFGNLRWSFQIEITFPDETDLNQILHFSQDQATGFNEPRLWVSTLNVAAEGETIDVHLTTGTGNEDDRWNAELSETWAQFVGAVTVGGDINGTGSTVIRIQVNPNTTTASRSVDLTITVEGTALDTVTFAQAFIHEQHALSVADTSVAEDAGPMIFTVTLSPVSSSTVTVDYETQDGTATAPADYTSTSGTLEFTAGTVSREVRVPIADDSENDPGETFTLTLSNASGARIEDSEATGTINNTDPIPRAWLARFGRTAAVHVADAIQWRLERRSPALSATQHVELPITPAGRMRVAQGRTGRLVEEPARPLSGRVSYPSQRGFLYSFDSGETPTSRLSAWARSSTTRFAGASGGLSINGDVQTSLLGLDAERGRWLAGLALAHTKGHGGYGHLRTNGGEVNSDLTSIHPYARFALNANTGIWATFGLGDGTMFLAPDGSSPIETGIQHTMAAIGGRGRLSAKVTKAGLLELALRSDAVISRTASEAADNLAEEVGKAGRARALLEGTGSFRLGTSGVIEPSLTIGVRYDAGDAETGGGLELGGGLAYRTGRWNMQMQVRSLTVHQDASYRERGYSASVEYRPKDDGTGVNLNVRSSWSLDEAAFGAMWDADYAVVRAQPFLPRQQMQFVLGYGLPALYNDAVMVPFIGIVTGQHGQSTRVGVRLNKLHGIHADLHLGVRKVPGGERDYGVSLRWIATFWNGD